MKKNDYNCKRDCDTVIMIGDAVEKLREIDDGTVDCCVTSPPYYGLRDYGVDGQIGLEQTPEEYIDRLVEVFRDGHAVRNIRDVWTITNKPYKGAHFACYPPDLIEPCILAGSRFGGTVLDPFIGSGTTAQVCQKLGRDCIGIELNESYVPLINERLGEELCVK